MSIAPRRSVIARFSLGAISFYQAAFASPLPRCRYLPTCSDYARQAIEHHGAAKGSWLAAKRIGRCHPLGGHGYDPVPLPAQGQDVPPDTSAKVV